MTDVQNDAFWMEDHHMLLNKDRLTEYIPTKSMTAAEKLNAISRLFLYFGIILVFVYNDMNYLFVTIIAFAMISFVYTNLSKRHESQQATSSTPSSPTFQRTVDEQSSDQTKEQQPPQQGGEGLQTPKENNPFMNVLLSDDFTHREPAANLSHPEVRSEAETYFNKGLNRNVNDIWCRSNSQRQFYATPATTVPNDRESFKNWCFKSPATCKEGNNTRCLATEDVRGQARHNCISN